MDLKDEEGIIRKKSSIGKSTLRGRGSECGRGRSTIPRAGASNNNSNQHTPIRSDTRRRGSFSKGIKCKGRGREFT